MRIDLTKIDREQFMVHEHVIADETCYLVQPQHIGALWRSDNLHLRSSVWNSEGELISASFPKFVNWEEKPELYPLPASLDNTVLIDKIDGSTLIVSKYRGQVISRTRGTVDARKLDNGHEVDVLMAKYPSIGKFFSMEETMSCSLIFEWTSPLNRIVLDYGTEADLVLIGAIHHDSYRLWPQDELDVLSVMMKIKRPLRYSFNTIPEMIAAVGKLVGKEGLCVYYDNDQRIRKVKSAQYLLLHRFKERVTLPNLTDMFFEYNRPDVETFLARIESAFDFECAAKARELVTQICDTYNCVISRYNLMESKIAPLRVTARKAAAAEIYKADEGVWRAAGFHLLDNRPLDDKMVRKLMEHELEH